MTTFLVAALIAASFVLGIVLGWRGATSAQRLLAPPPFDDDPTPDPDTPPWRIRLP